MRMEFRTLRSLGLSRARALTRSTTSRRSRLASIAGIVGLASAALVGAVPTFWTVSTQSEFLKGDVEDLSVDSDGRMFLGPSTSLVAETAAPFLWAVATGADGTLWAGTGNEGKVLKIGKDGKVATFFDATELEVHAIVPAPNNGLYVATSPDGKIYQVDADGSSRTFFDPEDKYIWALALDRTGNLFAATGDKGVIYKITPDGKGTRFYKTSSTNVVSLAFSPSGDLLAGTESPGRVFRIDASGKAFGTARLTIQGDSRAATDRRWHAVRGGGERIDCGHRRSVTAAEYNRQRSRAGANGIDGNHGDIRG